MAITLENSAMVYPGGASQSFGTFNIDCGTNPDRLVLLYAVTYAGSYGVPTGVQLASSSMTALFNSDWDLWSNYFRITCYYYINPGTGSQSITGTTYSSAWNTYLCAMAFSGALQSAPTNYNGAGGQLNESQADITITPVDATSYLVECINNWNDTTCTNVAASSQTKVQEQSPYGGTATAAGGYTSAGATSLQTRSWNFTPDSTVNMWVQSIVELQPSAAGAVFNALQLGLNT